MKAEIDGARHEMSLNCMLEAIAAEILFLQVGVP